MLAAAVTVWWVHRELEREAAEWDSPEVHKLYNLHIEQSEEEKTVARQVTREEPKENV